jgi:hypothetical protein
MPFAVSCFAIFPAFCPTQQQKPPVFYFDFIGDDIRLQLRPFDLAVLRN